MRYPKHGLSKKAEMAVHRQVAERMKNIITILGDDKKPVQVAVVAAPEGLPGADVTYRMPQGYLASASWRLMFIREAMELCDPKTFDLICARVGMPDEYDWSFVRDADGETLAVVSALLYFKVGPAMTKMGLTSVTKWRGK